MAHDINVFPENKKIPGVHYVQGDIRSETISEFLQQFSIDTVVHLASIVTPGKKSNRDFEYSVDVLGTENILKASVANHVKHFLVTSSGAAYGYHQDNPKWLSENDMIRGNKEFAYSCHKRLVEEMLERYRKDHPEMKQLILRPGTILGEKTNNQITDLFKKKFVIGIKGADIPFVFIWDKDVASIIEKGIIEDKEGIYNLAGDGILTMKQIAKLLDKPYFDLPVGWIRIMLSAGKKLGWSQYGPEQVDFLRYRPVLSNINLKEKFGYIPKYNSSEVFNIYTQANFYNKQ